MQSKTILLALAGVLCAAVLGYIFLGTSTPQPLAGNFGDAIAATEDMSPAELVGSGAGEPEIRSEFEGPQEGLVARTGGRAGMVVRGRVVDKLSVPVAGAKVFLTASDRNRRGRNRNRIEKEAVTADDGTFAFRGSGFARMWIALEVRHASFAPTSLAKSFDNAGEHDFGDVPVLVGGTIEGSVTDAQGVAIPNATLALEAARFDWRRMMGRRNGASEVRTDANGIFRLDHVTPGSYRIRAQAPRHQRASSGTVAVVDTQRVRLDPIELGPGFVLSGAVSKPSGAPLENAVVKIRGGRTRERVERTNEDGEFRFDHLRAGSYDVEVEANGYLRNQDLKGISVAESGPLVIAMRPGLFIEGVVTDAETGVPLPRFAARVRRLGNLPDPAAERERARSAARMREMGELMRMGDRRTEDQQKKFDALMAEMRSSRGRGRGRGGWGRNANRNENLPGDVGDVKEWPEGRFRFDGLEEGVYVVDIGSPDHQKLRTAKLELRQGAVPAPLSVVVQGGLSVAGKVSSRRGNAPLDKARVELRMVLPETPREYGVDGASGATRLTRAAASNGNGLRTTKVLETRSSRGGSFAIDHAPAGRYVLRVTAEDHATFTSEPFDLGKDLPGFAVSMGALGVIEGRVGGMSADGAGETKVMVFRAPRTMRDTSVAEDGTFRISGLEPGNYMVRAYVGEGGRGATWREMFRSMGDADAVQQVDVTVKEGGSYRFDPRLTVQMAGEVVGRVLVNGVGAAGYRVSLRKVRADNEGNGGMGRWGRSPRATVAANGDYRIERVEPGDYQVVVSSSRRRRGGGDIARTRIYVNAQETVTVPVVAVDFGSLSGTVADSVDAKEKVRISGRVSLYRGVTAVPDPSAPGGEEILRFSARVRDGKFAFTELPAGSYLMQLRVSGREAVTRTVFVGAGDRASLDLKAGKKRAPQSR